MFDKEEIKRRFEMRDVPIDRHGNFVRIGGDWYKNYGQFQALLQYHLLAGMSDDEAIRRLRDADLSAFEAKYILNDAKRFINDVLDYNLEGVRAAHNSTAQHCGQRIVAVIEDLNLVAERLRYEPITLDDHVFQTTAKSREAIQSYLLSNTSPSYWVLENNEQVPFTEEQLGALNRAIAERDATIHETITQLKTEARTYCEREQYAQLVELHDRVRAM